MIFLFSSIVCFCCALDIVSLYVFGYFCSIFRCFNFSFIVFFSFLFHQTFSGFGSNYEKPTNNQQRHGQGKNLIVLLIIIENVVFIYFFFSSLSQLNQKHKHTHTHQYNLKEKRRKRNEANEKWIELKLYKRTATCD